MKNCVYRSVQTRKVIEYIRNEYGDELEFLWPKFPTDAIWRNRATRKWYALLMTIARSKLGLESDEMVEVLDVRFDKNEARDFAASNENVYPGYHMNKNSWITIILDGSMKDEEVFRLVDHSYALTMKKKK